MKLNTKLIILALTGIFGPVTANFLGAQMTAVNFGADYTSTNINAAIAPTVADVDADFDGNSDDRAATVAFGTEFSPPNSSSWTTPSGKSGAVIRHGASVGLLDWNSGTDPEASIELDRINADDIIQVTNGAGTTNLRMASAFYWEKSSFINGADGAGALSFANEAASISIDFVNTGTPTNPGGRVSRALVQSDGSWYVSDEVFGGTTGTLEFNGSTTDWYDFDPQTDTLFLDEDSLGSSISGTALNDINAMGLYSQMQLIDGSSKNAVIQGFNGMEVTMVPEPSTYALVIGVMVLGLAVRRRLR